MISVKTGAQIYKEQGRKPQTWDWRGDKPYKFPDAFINELSWGWYYLRRGKLRAVKWWLNEATNTLLAPILHWKHNR